MGSSPRMRGTPIYRVLVSPSGGIIPAYAGNTGHVRHEYPGLWDHPRVCGEHSWIFISVFLLVGSSPRMRGTHEPEQIPSADLRIIPAYAGNTHFLCIVFSPCGDHPRVCGEHRLIGGRRRGAVGSSPRMRGTPERFEYRPEPTGIIPAYAGNTR